MVRRPCIAADNTQTGSSPIRKPGKSTSLNSRRESQTAVRSSQKFQYLLSSTLSSEDSRNCAKLPNYGASDLKLGIRISTFGIPRQFKKGQTRKFPWRRSRKGGRSGPIPKFT